MDEIDCQELAYAYLRWKDGGGFKRCKSCGRLMRSKRKKEICPYCEDSDQANKFIWCIECGAEVEVPAKDTHTCRCEECRRNYRNDYMRKYMDQLRSGTDSC